MIDTILAAARALKGRPSGAFEVVMRRDAPESLIKAFQEGGYRITWTEFIPQGEIMLVDHRAMEISREMEREMIFGKPGGVEPKGIFHAR